MNKCDLISFSCVSRGLATFHVCGCDCRLRWQRPCVCVWLWQARLSLRWRVMVRLRTRSANLIFSFLLSFSLWPAYQFLYSLIVHVRSQLAEFRGAQCRLMRAQVELGKWLSTTVDVSLVRSFIFLIFLTDLCHIISLCQPIMIISSFSSILWLTPIAQSDANKCARKRMEESERGTNDLPALI